MSSILRFLRTWMLAVSIILGALMYMVFVWFPALKPFEDPVLHMVKTVQPWFIFAMLFITFCKVNPHDLEFVGNLRRGWHARHLLLQGGSFTALALVLLLGGESVAEWCPVIESAMLCLICPTATAAAVVTGKLGGNMASLTSYTILINLLVAVLIPAVVALISPDSSMGFFPSFLLIVGKVFPLLICPLLLSLLLRWLAPGVLHYVTHIKDLAFYLWAVSLALAIMVSVRSLYVSTASFAVLCGIGVVSLLSCVVQFGYGRVIGKRCGEPISAGQALGQKNTVFLIWCGYTFFDPVTSIAGGFYSIWHNLWNSYQIARKAQN